jgi:hypothetical protein
MHAVPARLSRSSRKTALPLHRRTRTGNYTRATCCRWQARALSTAAPAADGDAGASPVADEKPQEILIYEGGRAKPLRILKTASFINCTASLIGSPIIVTADIAMPFAARLGMATTMAFFGLSTTGAHRCRSQQDSEWRYVQSNLCRTCPAAGFLAWVSKPYLLRMALRQTECGVHPPASP